MGLITKEKQSLHILHVHLISRKFLEVFIPLDYEIWRIKSVLTMSPHTQKIVGIIVISFTGNIQLTLLAPLSFREKL